MKKRGTIILLFLVAILGALTGLYVVLKNNETMDRLLLDIYYDIAIWGVVIWQIVVIICCIFLWKKVFNNVNKPALYIGRGMSLIFTCVILLYLSGRWFGLFWDDRGKAVMEKDNYMLVKDITYDNDGYYSIWSKDGLFYRTREVNIGIYADTVAEGYFYKYIKEIKNNTEDKEILIDRIIRGLTKEQIKDYEFLNKFVEITESIYPDKIQRYLEWQEKECDDNSIGIVKIPIIEENGMQDLSWFCENICDWLEECLTEVSFEDAPWLYKEIIIGLSPLSESFELYPYVGNEYNREALYSALYDFIDQKLTSQEYASTPHDYGKLNLIEGSEEYFQGLEPDCTYTTKDGAVYGMLPIDRAGGSNYYSLVAYEKSDSQYTMINQDPFNGVGGQAEWITFIDDSNLGFACLTYNGGDDAFLYRTSDGGKSFISINYPSAKVKLLDGTIYNPFVIPQKVWVEEGSLYMLAGQSLSSGDYYSEELGKHPSGLYVSHDDGLSFEYVGEQ